MTIAIKALTPAALAELDAEHPAERRPFLRMLKTIGTLDGRTVYVRGDAHAGDLPPGVRRDLGGEVPAAHTLAALHGAAGVRVKAASPAAAPHPTPPPTDAAPAAPEKTAAELFDELGSDEAGGHVTRAPHVPPAIDSERARRRADEERILRGELTPGETAAALFRDL